MAGDADKLPDPPQPDPSQAAAASADGDTPPDKPKRNRPTTRAARAEAAEKKRGPGRPPKPKIGERCGAMIAGIGMGVAAFNPEDGKVIIGGAEELGMALEKWAEESPAVDRVLRNLLEASAAGMVLMASMKIAIPIAANHGMLPGQIAGAAAALAGDVPDYPPAPSDGQQAA